MRDEIIKMAREAGLPYEYDTGRILYLNQLERFFHMAQAAEREACAKVCENAINSIWEYSDEQVKETGRNVCTNLAAAIRARGQT